MENSATSRICTEPEEDQDQDQATSFHEDSGWTSYMDDLLVFDITTSDDDHNALLSSSSSSTSCENFESRRCSSVSHDGSESSACCRNLTSDKTHRKRRNPAPDDDLEDTATSSAHPAVSKMAGFSSKQKKKQREITQAKQKGKGSGYGEVEDRIEMGFMGRDKNCSTGLKHIGLCLVPVSMAVHYFG